MTSRLVPDAGDAIRLLREYFFSRTDVVAFLGPWNSPHPGEGGERLDALLTAHIHGRSAPEATIRYRKRNGSAVALSGRFRIGSYTPAPGNKTKWLCVDFDGKGHADALADPEAVARRSQDILRDRGIPSYLERSGGGNGWHLWVFFTEPVPAKSARKLAFELMPRDFPLADGGQADPRKGRGIEIFPKQTRIKKKGFGNLVWLPWWSEASNGGNLFYRPGADNVLEPYSPEGFDTVDESVLDLVLADLPDGNKDQEKFPSTSEDFKGRWSEWRSRALAALPLDSIYGDFLTGSRSGEGWLECRDPESPTGDRNPSAGVSEGTNGIEKGAFHSFISGRTISVFDFMVERGLARDFRDAVDRVAALSGVPPPSQDAGPPMGKSKSSRISLPEIQVNNRQLRDIIDDAWRVVIRANKTGGFIGGRKPFLFLRGGSLVRLVEGVHGPLIHQMDEAAIYGLLTRVADWVRITDEVCSDVMPVKDVARDMLAYPSDDLPFLDSVVSTPVFGTEGSLIASPGYHSHDRLWFHPTENMKIPEVPDSPSREDIDAARSLFLDDLLVDFPFIADSDRAHAMAAIILPFVRRMIGGCSPLHLIEAPTAGSGKGLLSNLISLIATNNVADGRTLTTQDDEARKMFTAELMKGRPIILLDNISEKKEVNSPVLASVLTAESWTDRILGQTNMVTIPNRALWLLTANNPRLSMEIARRCVRIRIDPRIDRPWQRDKFKHMEITDWTRNNRARLVHAVLVLVKAWIAAGRPLYRTRLGSFESWSATMGGILEVAGVKGFLGSLEELYEMADAEGQRWREFTAAWWEAFKEEPKNVSELNDLCDRLDLMMANRGDGTNKSQQTRLGKALLSARDRVFDGLRIDKVKIKSKKRGRAFYRLVQVDDSFPGGAGPKSRGEGSPQSIGDPQGDPLGDPHNCAENIDGCGDGGHGGHLFPDPRARAGAHARTHARAHVQTPDEVTQVTPDPLSLFNEREKVGVTSRNEVTPRCPQVTPDSEIDIDWTSKPIDLASLPEDWNDDDY